MLLQLKYQPQSENVVLAALVSGNTPQHWLREMDAWKVDLQTLKCYIMPESISANNGVGLFVVFNQQFIPAPSTIRNPYTRLADKLYVPVNAVLYPVIGTNELKTLLLWDVQVFHPVIGMVGFEHKDEVDLSSFITLPPPVPANWGFASPGVESPPLFTQISLEADVSSADPIAQMKDDIGCKLLEEIPSSNPDEKTVTRYGKATGNLLVKISLYILLFLAMIGKVLFDIINTLFSINRSSNTGSGGALQKLENWVGKRLENLEKQRDSEIKRLLNLFDKNTDEALQYAIPLANPYLNRGTAIPTGKLARRSLEFNLRNLGGGSRVDGWDIGAYNYELRKRYEQAANDAISVGNFKRAAYIYAHLLGNFPAAANVLQQGKFYREAAALYKDHVKNERMAAECLESGGLLSEAIPLYVNLHQLEKAGDLSRQLGREEKAIQFYRQTVNEFKTGKAYQKAAELTLHKLNEREDALRILLEGWKDDNNPEACLTAYFEYHHDQDIVNEIKMVYANHVPRLRKTPFLNVLAHINRNNKNEKLSEASLDMAYTIINQQVEIGDTSGLSMLNAFVPQDRLLHADATRFIQNRIKLPPVNNNATYIQLRNDTQWFSAVTYHDQLLAIGLVKNDLHFMRANWDGKFNYQYLFKAEPPVWLLADPGLSDQALILGPAVSSELEQKLEADLHFDRELWLRSIKWLPDGILGCCLNANNGISTLSFDIHGLLLNHYTLKGELLMTHPVQVDDDRVWPGQAAFNASALVFRKEHFYFAIGEVLIRITLTGEHELVALDAPIIKFVVSAQHAALKIAVLTENGCLMVTPLHKEMKITSAHFGFDAAGRDLKLMTDNRLVIAGEKRAMVYELSGGEPSLKGIIDTENVITCIIAVPKRNHCAFLESDNRISIYQIEG